MMNSMQQTKLATQPKKKDRYDQFKGIINLVKHNPLTKAKPFIAKDLSYPNQHSDEALVLCWPLAQPNLFMYVSSYIDSRSQLPERTIRITTLEEQIPGNAQRGAAKLATVNTSKRREQIRLNKGARYVGFMVEYLDPTKNKLLYKNDKSIVCDKKRKYDTEDVNRQENSGYVEMTHHRLAAEGRSFVQIIQCQTMKSSAASAVGIHSKNIKSCSLLDEELFYVYSYLSCMIQVYKLDEASMMENLEARHVAHERNEVLSVLKNLPKSGQDAGAGPSRKRKQQKQTKNVRNKKKNATTAELVQDEQNKEAGGEVQEKEPPAKEEEETNNGENGDEVDGENGDEVDGKDGGDRRKAKKDQRSKKRKKNNDAAATLDYTNLYVIPPDGDDDEDGEDDDDDDDEDGEDVREEEDDDEEDDDAREDEEYGQIM